MPNPLSHSALLGWLALAGSAVACGSSTANGSATASAGSSSSASAGSAALGGSNGAAGSAGVTGLGAAGSSAGGASSTAGASSAGSANGGASSTTPPPPTQPCGAALPAPTPGGSAMGPVLQVDVCANRHVISPDIYGVTFWFAAGDTLAPNMQFAKDIGLPLNRLGGDATTRYNWQVDSSNAGFDFYFMGGSGATPVPGASNDALVTTNQSFSAKTVMTVPIIDYINKSADTHCSYPKSVYPNQQAYNPYVHPNNDDCGNGKDSGGNVITDTHITDHDVANDPSIQQAWVAHLVSKFGTAAKGGVPIYQMDNEPTGWPGIHFDVRPNSPSCEELRDRTYAYAAAVKAADPTAAVLGPGDIPVADDFDCSGPTRGEYYLAAMADYEKQHGVRILDYYSHHYPGCCTGDPIANLEARIKKHQSWIAANYPGTKLGYDEYNWGTDVDTYATALLSADGLGVFGRDSVDMASFWGLDDARDATGTVFRLYRNYDGKGGAFGDVSTSAASSDTTQLHVYAAQRTSDGAVTIVVVNKTAADITSALALSNHEPSASAHVFLFSSAQPKSVVAQPDLAISDPGNVVLTYPASSATLLVVP
ncbi:MAG TPA: glycoside hydrolase family 44 protein [Polyangiaceae bacterium]|jgi:hypothetical protein|nr:glycoside hydrolase family 44 protein [Polyangiaceae bacterium]